MNRLSRMNYSERKAYRESRKDAIAEEKARKDREAMTCQCCGRKYFAQAGSIAHHGYQRPGYGWQTASCMGAKYLPFEVDRSRLEVLIVRLERDVQERTEALRRIAEEWDAVPFEAANYNAKPTVDAHHKRIFPTVKLEFTRDNFERLVAENTGPRGSEKLFDAYSALVATQRGFDTIKSAEMTRRTQALAGAQLYLRECRARYVGWLPTHAYFDHASKQWVPIEGPTSATLTPVSVGRYSAAIATGDQTMRIQIPAYTDRWMMGDRFGVVTRITRRATANLGARAALLTSNPHDAYQEIAHVKLDKSGKVVRVILADCTEV